MPRYLIADTRRVYEAAPGKGRTVPPNGSGMRVRVLWGPKREGWNLCGAALEVSACHRTGGVVRWSVGSPTPVQKGRPAVSERTFVCAILPFEDRSCPKQGNRPLLAGSRVAGAPAADTVEQFVEPDELAIYDWINPLKPPEQVKRERHGMVALLAVRYGVHHYVEDIWQEWQLAVHQRTGTAPPVPVEQREVFSFGIARNLCRAYHRKDRRMIPIIDAGTPPDRGSAGIREEDLGERRLDRPSEPANRPLGPTPGSDPWDRTGSIRDCIKRLRPRAQQVLRETYLEGKSSREVGQQIGLSAENVRQQLRRARDELRRCMDARLKRAERKDWKHAGSNE